MEMVVEDELESIGCPRGIAYAGAAGAVEEGEGTAQRTPAKCALLHGWRLLTVGWVDRPRVPAVRGDRVLLRDGPSMT